MSWVSIVGFAAALCSTLSFVPQAVRIVRPRDAKSLSAPMYALTTTGFCLCFAFGVGLGWPAEHPVVLIATARSKAPDWL